jgi:hypothetical protein
MLIPQPDDTVLAKQYGAAVIHIHNPRTPDSATKTIVFVDKDVLGKVYGQTLRRMFFRLPFENGLHVVFPFALGKVSCPETVETCVTFGASINSAAVESLQPLKKLIIIHPNMLPPKRIPKANEIYVMLPGIDEKGVNDKWRSWCQIHHIPFSMTSNCGLDIQSCADSFLIKGNL